MLTAELLGLQVGDSESEPFWREFQGSLKQRGLLAYGWWSLMPTSD